MLSAHPDEAARFALAPEASTAGVLAEGLNRLSGEAAAQDLWLLIAEVHITAGSMVLHLSWEALAQNLGLQPEVMNSDVMSVQQAFQRRRRGAETRRVTGTVAPQPDPVLQQNLARASLGQPFAQGGKPEPHREGGKLFRQPRPIPRRLGVSGPGFPARHP